MCSNRQLLGFQLWRGLRDINQESIQLGSRHSHVHLTRLTVDTRSLSGLTKVFLRKEAHDVLESRRSRRVTSAIGTQHASPARRNHETHTDRRAKLHDAPCLILPLLRLPAVSIQGAWKSRLTRLLYLYKLWSVRVIQRYQRGHSVRRAVEVLRRHRAVLLVQTRFR